MQRPALDSAREDVSDHLFLSCSIGFTLRCELHTLSMRCKGVCDCGHECVCVCARVCVCKVGVVTIGQTMANLGIVLSANAMGKCH